MVFIDLSKRTQTIVPEKTFESCVYAVSAGDGISPVPVNPNTDIYQLCCSCPSDKIRKKYKQAQVTDRDSGVRLTVSEIANFKMPELSMLTHSQKSAVLTEKICGKCLEHTFSQEYLNRNDNPPKPGVTEAFYESDSPSPLP